MSRSVPIVLEEYGGKLLEGKYAVVPLVELGKMLKDAKDAGRRDSSTSVRQYSRRYEVLRDLLANDCKSQPLMVDATGTVRVLQGDLLDRFVDAVVGDPRADD